MLAVLVLRRCRELTSKDCSILAIAAWRSACSSVSAARKNDKVAWARLAYNSLSALERITDGKSVN